MSSNSDTEQTAKQEQSTLEAKLKSTDAGTGLDLDPTSKVVAPVSLIKEYLIETANHLITESNGHYDDIHMRVDELEKKNEQVFDRVKKHIDEKMHYVIRELTATFNNKVDELEMRMTAQLSQLKTKPSPALLPLPPIDHKVSTHPESSSPSISRSFPSRPSIDHKKSIRPESSSPSTSRSFMTRPSRSTPSINRDRSRSPHPVSHHNKVRCSFCNSDHHKTRYCNSVKSASQRQSIMRGRNECPKCFRLLDARHPKDCLPRDCERGCCYGDGVPKKHMDYMCPRNTQLTE